MGVITRFLVPVERLKHLAPLIQVVHFQIVFASSVMTYDDSASCTVSPILKVFAKMKL